MLPPESVNPPAATSTVVAPSADGVKVAVYTVSLVEAKFEIVPPLTVMSSAAKSLVAEFAVKVSVMEASLLVSPLVTSSEVIVIVGDVVSYTQLN